MKFGELLLLCVSALVVSAVSLIGIATTIGRGDRVPHALQMAIAPSAGAMGRWWKRLDLAIAVAFVLVSQALLLLWLLSDAADLPGAAAVVTEFALVLFLVLYLTRRTNGRPPAT